MAFMAACTFAGRQIIGSADLTSVAEETLVASAMPSTLQLLADNSPHRHTRPPRSFLEPRDQLVCKTYC